MIRSGWMVLGLGLTLWGQVQNRRQDWMVWDGSQVVLVRADEGRKLVIEGPGREGSAARSLQGPEGTLRMEYKDHAAWATVRGSQGITTLQRSQDLRTWAVNATYDGGAGRAQAIHHLNGRRYLMVSGPTFFQLGGRMSLLALADVDEQGFLKISELVDLGLREPLVSPAPEAGPAGSAKGVFNLKYSALLAMVVGEPLLRYPGGIALLARRPGYLWLFDERTGALKRWVKLYSSVSEEKLGSPAQLEWAILGCQPRPDGHLLVASREEAAVLTGLREFPRDKRLSQLANERQQHVNVAQDQASLSQWPRILWWDLDPGTGSFRPEAAPQNVPHEILDLETFHQFRFRFDIRGNLVTN